VQQVRLVDQPARLAPGVVYTWFIVLRTDPESPARDLLAQGWILRRDALSMDAVEPGARPAQLAAAGLWYDALAASFGLRALEPDNASIERALASLLAQGGVPLALQR
jgi:hypothetical protein